MLKKIPLNILAITLVIMGFILLVAGFLLIEKHRLRSEKQDFTSSESCLQLSEPPASDSKDCLFTLEVVSTPQKRLRGLSERQGLPSDRGMLFAFDKVTEQCMWMKDMRFSIDMMWLDEDKKINKIEQNVAPETYPATFCVEDTKYVIELNSGDVQKSGFAVGQELSF